MGRAPKSVDEIQGWTAAPKCAKCRSGKTAQQTYCTVDGIPITIGHKKKVTAEYLACKCPDCGYEWNIQTADASDEP
jgi:hypothetical protein